MSERLPEDESCVPPPGDGDDALREYGRQLAMEAILRETLRRSDPAVERGRDENLHLSADPAVRLRLRRAEVKRQAGKTRLIWAMAACVGIMGSVALILLAPDQAADPEVTESALPVVPAPARPSDPLQPLPPVLPQQPAPVVRLPEEPPSSVPLRPRLPAPEVAEKPLPPPATLPLAPELRPPSQPESAWARLMAAPESLTVFRAGEKLNSVAGLVLVGGDVLVLGSVQDQEARVDFADGTRVCLFPDTRVDFSDKEGRKHLDILGGRVVCEVAPQPRGKPLLIESAKARFIVLGTRFEIEDAEDGSRISVSRGAVLAERKSDRRQLQVRAGFALDVSERSNMRLRPQFLAGEISFQAGQFPDASYAGAREATAIRSAENGWSLRPASGLVEADGQNSDARGEQLAGLFQWDLSDLPRDRRVTGARLVLHLENESDGQPYDFSAVHTPWEKIRLLQTAPWSGDPLGRLAPVELGRVSVELNEKGLAVIQGWIRSPETNRGLALHGDSANGLRMISSLDPDVLRRPVLTLQIRLGD